VGELGFNFFYNGDLHHGHFHPRKNIIIHENGCIFFEHDSMGANGFRTLFPMANGSKSLGKHGCVR
jgi:hypothetical protein